MGWRATLLVAVLALVPVQAALSDELTQIVQKDLITLGYDPGPADGEPSVKTTIAVSKFQAEHNMEATGAITPQLAGVIQATISQKTSPVTASSTATATATPAKDPATLKQRQEACLQEKIESAKQASSMRSGFGKLLSAVSRTSSRFGGGSVASEISTTTGDIYSVNASVSDLEGAAQDLGISETDVEACRDP